MAFFRSKNNKCEGHHHHRDETFPLSSRHVDKALLEAAFTDGRQPRRGNNPLRYWAIAGWGPVPAALRAPKGIYRELQPINPSDHDQTIPLFGGPLWFEKHHQQNIIFRNDRLCETKVGEVRWVALVGLRDDTAVDTDAIVWSQALETFRPPIDKAAGREYIEMRSGEFLVRDVFQSLSGCLNVVRVGNAAVGKWFWEFYPRCNESLLSQVVVWHESVDDTDEYKTPQEGPENEVVKKCHPSQFPRVDFNFDTLVKNRKAALAVVETFLWTADAEPQLKHGIAQFMGNDPNGLWWKRGELPDGFLLSDFNFGVLGIFVGEMRCEKLCFVDTESCLSPDSTGLAPARTIMGGCVVEFPVGQCLLSIQFKPSRATGKIVAMRAVSADTGTFDEGRVACGHRLAHRLRPRFQFSIDWLSNL